MIIKRKFKPENIVSKDANRDVLTYVNLSNGYLYATDGRKMVKFGVTVSPKDHSGLIPSECFSLSRKGINKKIEEIGITVEKDNVFISHKSQQLGFTRKQDGEFPNCENVIPKDEPKIRISINANYLKQIQDSMGSDGVILEIYETNKAIVVKSNDSNDDVLGILMPLTLSK